MREATSVPNSGTQRYTFMTLSLIQLTIDVFIAKIGWRTTTLKEHFTDSRIPTSQFSICSSTRQSTQVFLRSLCDSLRWHLSLGTHVRHDSIPKVHCCAELAVTGPRLCQMLRPVSRINQDLPGPILKAKWTLGWGSSMRMRTDSAHHCPEGGCDFVGRLK